MVDVFDKSIPPHNLDAERAVLGACLLFDSAVLESAGLVTPAEFYREAHQHVYTAILALFERRATVDLLTVTEELKAAHRLDAAGGPAYLASLTDGVPRSTNVAAYAGIVREKAQLRRIVDGARQLVADASAPGTNAKSVIEDAQRTLLDLASGATKSGFRSMREIMPDVMAQLEAWATSKTGVTGIATGLHELDQLTCGFQAPQLIIIAARPGMGKSSLANDIATFAARGGVVGVFSLEMEDTELAMRALSADAGIDGYRLKGGRLTEAEWARMAASVDQLGELNLHIDSTPRLSPFEVRARARRLKAEQGGLSLLIVDYTQLMIGDEKERENRNLEIGNITGSMKALAKELRIPIIMLSQLSRDVERRADKRPILADLRDGGAIEQDADIVIFIYREEAYLTPAQRAASPEVQGIAELIVAKQRNGPTGTVKVVWLDHQTRFVNLAEQPAEAERLPYAERA